MWLEAGLIKTEVRDATFTSRDLVETFKYNIIYLTFTFQRPLNGKNNDSLLILLDGLWKEKAEYMV